MPHIPLCALVLAAFEIAVGLMLLGKEKWVKYGLAFSIFFNGCLVLLGLGSTGAPGWPDFLMNRLPNLFFIAIQIPLFWATFDASFVALIRRKIAGKTS